MTNVLFVSHSSELRGAEKSLELFLRLVDKTRLLPVVAMPGKGPLYELISRMGVPVYDVPIQWWVPPSNDLPARLAVGYSGLPGRLEALRKIARRHGCRAVHSNSLVVADGALAALLDRIPHVWHIREDLSNGSGLEPILGRKETLSIVESLSESIIVVSEATARQFDTSHQVEVIYNGVELEVAAPAELPGDPASLKVAFVGNLIERKGPDLFLEACLMLEPANIEFYFIGEHSDERLTRRMLELLERRANRERFHFLGFRMDIAAVLSACDIYVLSSRNDPFPRSVLEAMAAGCAVVTTDCGGAAEAVRACSAGEVVSATAEGVLRGLNCLIKDPSYMGRCQESARALVSEKFSAASYVAKLSDLLQETAATSPSKVSPDVLLNSFYDVQRVEFEMINRAFSTVQTEYISVSQAYGDLLERLNRMWSVRLYRKCHSLVSQLFGPRE